MSETKEPKKFWVEKGSFMFSIVENKRDLNGWGEPFEVVEASAYDTLKAENKRMRTAIENTLQQCGSLHKPIYFLWLREALASGAKRKGVLP